MCCTSPSDTPASSPQRPVLPWKILALDGLLHSPICSTVCQAACLFGRRGRGSGTCEQNCRLSDLAPIRTYGLQLAAANDGHCTHGVTHSFVNYSLICMLSAAKEIAAESRPNDSQALNTFSVKSFH